MNYAGKFDATISADGPGTHHAPAYVHIDSPHAKIPADAIIVPDAHLLFNADFKRSGVDLILSKDDRELVLHDYFKGEKRAPLSSPDGAHLTGDLVNALTGAVQYSQADGTATAGKIIGHVTKLTGEATAVRNGVSIILHLGDDVEKGDIVQSGSDSTLGITFIDGTVFGLSSNARMVLNEMVYDPNGSNNATAFSLVAGTISFVAGQTAKHGDMKIDTPVATMGIRGTAVLVTIDFDVSTSVNGAPATPTATFQVLIEPDGTTGDYVLLDKVTQQVVGHVNAADVAFRFSDGAFHTQAASLTPGQQDLVSGVFQQAVASFQGNVTKSASSSGSGSITPIVDLVKTATTGDGTTTNPNVTTTVKATVTTSVLGLNGVFHISGAPTAVLLDTNGQPKTSFALDDIGLATIAGVVNFSDINAGDTPTVKVNFSSFSYQNAEHQDISANLTALQLAEIAAAAADIVVVPNPNNKNFGSATWTYAVPGAALDFLAPGQTLTLTYVARVDNNFALNDEYTSLPFTITITGVAAEVWIATTSPGSGGLWSDPSKWKSGHVPTATDDVIVMTDPLHGLTPSFPVTINAPAFAGSLTMNDFGTTAPVLINQSTLTIGSSLSIAADSVIQNFGTISVGGGAEILGTSQLTNAGTLSLAQGGDFTGQSKITNTEAGIIELVGGRLNILVNIGNSGLVQVDSDATLALNSAAIIGGAVTVSGTLELDGTSSLQSGTLTNTGQVNVSGTGNALDSETVINTAGIDVSGALLLDQGTTITNSGVGAVTVDITGTLTLDGASDGATIDGGTVTINGTLDLYGNGVLKNGSLANSGQINVSGSGNALDKETVTNSSGIDVSGALTIDQASTVDNTNGIITVDSSGTLTLNAATLTAGTVTNSGTFNLENATINGSKLGGAGTIATATGNTDSTLNGVTLKSGTTVTAAVGTLDLTGIITNNGELDAAGGIIDLENATLNGGKLGGAGTIATATGNTDSTLNGVTVNSGTTVTAAVGELDLTGTINAAGAEIDANSGLGISLDLENVTLNGGTLGGAGKIGTAAGNTDSTLNGVTLKSGTTVTAAVGELDLTGTINAAGAEIDANSGSGIAVDLESLILVGGTLGGLGTIATVSGANTLNGVAIAGGTTVKVTDNTALDLAGTIADVGTIALNSSGDSTQLKISGSVVLNGGGRVTLTDNTNNSIVSDGLAATLSNFDTITGAGTIGDSHLALMNSGAIDGTGSHPLIIDMGINTSTAAGLVGSLLVTNNAGGVLEASAGHTLQIDDNVLNNGLIEAGNTAVVNVTGNITGTGSIEIFNNAKLEIGGSVSSGQTVTFEVSNGDAELILDNPHGFQGLIKGLVEASSEAAENYIDLKGFSYTFQTKVVSASYNSTTNITEVTVTDGNSANNITIALSGDYQRGDIEFANDGAGGTLFSDPAANSGTVTIDSGTTLEIAAASTATVSFTNGNGNTGELVLDNSKAFTGQIVAFAGDGTISNSDLIDLTDINIADVATNKTSYIDNGNGTGTLTLYNASGQALDSITFAGSYQLANFTIESDGSGHALIVDPPVPSGTATANGHGGILTHDTPADSGTATTSDGVLEASAGLLKIDQSLSGGGHAVIDGGSIEFVGASDALVQFSGQTAGTLYLHDVAHFTGSVTGFSYGDTINLAGVDPANVSLTNSGSLEVHYGSAASDVFSLVGNYDPSGFTIGSDSKGTGTDIVWNHQTPAIETDQFSVARNPDGTTKISGLHVSDSDPAASTESFAVAATTDGSGSNVTIPSTGSGSLADVNTALGTGVTYNPGAAPPATDKVALTVADSFGATDTVNFIFSDQAAPNVALQGTAGKDVIFATGHQDILTGGGGADQFVFGPTSETAAVQHTITDFAAGLDRIDIRQFGNIGSLADLTEAKQGNDTLLTLDSHDSVLLKNVIAANLHANDFIISAHGS